MTRPLVIGIVGGSGSGKTTVVRAIVEAAGVSASVLDQDGYYHDLSHLALDERRQVNFDHPDSIDAALLAEHLERLVRGEAIEKPVYDFAAHTRAPERVLVEANPIIVVDGILLFADRRLRDLFDIKIYVDVADDIRFIRRLERDVIDRGRSMADVVRQYLATVRPMHLEFVEPSKRHADIILPGGGHNRIAIEMIVARVHSELQRRTSHGA
ncbi:MAG TPA: uridine kinase [Gemmatimonadales bacterium]|jgi:uridine kinase